MGEFRAFSGGLQSFQAISGASAEEVAKLKEEAIELGIATTKSPTQVAQAATAYARLGKSVSEATADLPGLIQLSESVGGSLESSAQVTATATKIFAGELTALEAANIITATTTNTAAGTVDEFNQVLSKAAGLAAANKVPFNELAATFGLLRDSGSSAEVAGTAVRNILQRLVVPGDKAKKAIAELGLQVRDESGQFVGLRNVIDQLRVSTEGLNDSARDEALSDIFGSQASSAITSLLALESSQVDRVFDNIANSSEGAGVAAGVAGTRLQGLNRTLTELEGTLQTASSEAGEVLAPALNIASQGVLKLVNFFNKAPEPVQRLVVGIGAIGAGAAAAVVTLSSLISALAANTLATIGLSGSQLTETASLAANTAAKAINTTANILSGDTQTLTAIKTGLLSAAQKANVATTGAQAIATAGLSKSLIATNPAMALAVANSTALAATTTGAAGATAGLTASVVSLGAALGSLAVAAAPFAAIAAGVGLVVTGLKDAGIIFNESRGAVSTFNETLGMTAKASDEVGEKLGFLDTIRQAVPFFDLQTSAQLKLNQATLAGAKINETLNATLDQGTETFQKFGVNLANEASLTGKTAEEKEKLQSVLESEIEQRNKSIEAAKAAVAADQNLAATVQPTIALLEKQNEQSTRAIAILNGETEARRQAEAAVETQKKSLGEITAVRDEATNAAERNLAELRAIAEEEVASGNLTQDQGQNQIAEAEKAALQERLKANQDFVSELRALQAEESGTPEAAAELQQQILDAEQEGFSLRSEIARSAIDEQKRISDEALKALEDSEAERQAKAVQATAQTRNAILTEQLNGVIDAQTAQEQIGQAEVDAIAARIDNQKQALMELQGAQGIGSEERIAKEQEINAEILSLENDLLSKQISLQESSTQARIKAVQDRLGKQASAVKTGLKVQEADLKASLANREITEEEYQQAVIGLKQEGTQSRIDQLKQEEQAIQDLAAQGLIPQEEAQMRLMAIQESVAGESIKLADQQIAQQKALADEIRNRAALEQESARLTLDLQNQALEGEKQSLQIQTDLAGAQQALGEAQTTLAVQRLKFAQEDAATLTESLAIGRQIFEAEKAGTLAKLETEKQVLEVKISQQQIDNEIATARAEIAVTEAQAALEAAKARDASAGELQNLEKVLKLKQGILGQTADSASAQEELFGIQRQTLAVNQEIAREEIARQEQLLNRQAEESVIQSIGSSAVSQVDQQQSDRLLTGLGRQTFADSGSEAEAIAKVAFGNLDNEALTGQLQGLGGFASEIGRLAEELRSAGISESEGRSLASKVDGDSGAEVVEILRELVAATRENSRPNVSVSTANPLSDTLDILRNS